MLLRGRAGRLAGKYQHKFRFKKHLFHKKDGKINYPIFLMLFGVVKKQS